jgi:pilus assembly protein FimV
MAWLLVQLASAAAFNQAGISRDTYLSQLTFSVATNALGDKVVLVSSQTSVTEPYLEFLVQLEWPSGRMIRAYTLLLDLPLYSGEKGSTLIQKATAGIQPSAPGRSDNRFSGPEHRVVVGDTLWNVAKRLRPSGFNHLANHGCAL